MASDLADIDVEEMRSLTLTDASASGLNAVVMLSYTNNSGITDQRLRCDGAHDLTDFDRQI